MLLNFLNLWFQFNSKISLYESQLVWVDYPMDSGMNTSSRTLGLLDLFRYAMCLISGWLAEGKTRTSVESISLRPLAIWDPGPLYRD